MLDEGVRGVGGGEGDLLVVGQVEVVDGEDEGGQGVRGCAEGGEEGCYLPLVIR